MLQSAACKATMCSQGKHSLIFRALVFEDNLV